MNLKHSSILAILLCLAAIGLWELYWRSTGRVPDLDDNKDLWAVQRAHLDKLGKDDVVIVGSSRILFDTQLDVWHSITGRKPLMLAGAGASPLPAIQDIARNSKFAGTLIIGITPGVFYSTINPHAPPIKRIQQKVDYYQKRTYAQRFNHILSLPLQKNLVMMSAHEEEWSDDVDLRNLLNNINIGTRAKDPFPPFNVFMVVGEDRNTRMTEKTASDTSFANSIIDVWNYFSSMDRKPEKEATVSFFLEELDLLKKRGVNVVLVRCPSSDGLLENERKKFPRTEYWDSLVVKSQVPAYHFEDYEELNQFYCPEWSHLSASDAEIFTAELVEILLKDSIINKKSEHAF